MASRRLLKKQINTEIAEIIDQCYDVITESPKNKEKMNKVIDEAVELYDQLIEAVNKYRSAENKGAYFADIESTLIKKVDALGSKVTIL